MAWRADADVPNLPPACASRVSATSRPPRPPLPPGGSTTRRVLRMRAGAPPRERDDVIGTEVPVSLVYNDVPFAVMMATPGDLADFALGFSLSEGIVADATELEVLAIDERLEGWSVAMRIPGTRAVALESRGRQLEGRSGCGLCGTTHVESVLRAPPVQAAPTTYPIAALVRALTELPSRQPLGAATGALHAAGWAGRDGRLHLVREDIGRHNALDKLVGAMAAACLDPADGFAIVTSRASYEMALKAAQAGMPLLAAISAPTALAISVADGAGMALVGFLREDGYAVYCHGWRLRDAAGGPAPDQGDAGAPFD